MSVIKNLVLLSNNDIADHKVHERVEVDRLFGFRNKTRGGEQLSS